MINNPPRNHTSIYISQHMKSHWTDFQKYVTAKGFSSFNGYVNHVMTEDFTNNFERVVNQKTYLKQDKKLDMYEDTHSRLIKKLNNYSDGEMLDLIHEVSDFRNLIMREAKKRDIRL